MAIKYFKQKRIIPVNGSLEERYVARIRIETVVDNEKIAELIEKNSSLSRGDIMSTLMELQTVLAWMLEEGHPVRLKGFGTFYPAAESKSVKNPNEITEKSFTRFRCLFKPDGYLKTRFRHVKYSLIDNEVREVMVRKNTSDIESTTAEGD